MLKTKTLKELLENPLIAEIAPDAIKNWDLTKEDFYGWTLQELAEKKGWRTQEKSFARLYEAAAEGKYYYKLYSEAECSQEPAKANVNMVYFPSRDKAADDRPWMLLVPGGGFVNVWNITEGWPIAQRYNELGYHVFILTYQVCVEGAAVKAMDDIARTMEIIKLHQTEFHLDPAKYMTCGFSAGGYIVCLWNTEIGYQGRQLPKPQACFPVYPVTSFQMMNKDGWKEKDRFAYVAVGCSMDEACVRCFEIPQHAEGFPPTALFATEEDDLVDPEHSKKLARVLVSNGIPCRIEIGPAGGHGFADGTGMCMEGWQKRAIEWYEQLK